MTTETKQKPKASTSSAQQEIEKVAKQFDEFDASVKEMTMDRMNMAPKQEQESEVKLSSKELDRKNDIYLKPARSISSKEKFNEKFRAQYEFAKEYVQFIGYHKEIQGEKIETWTKPFPGMPAEYWEIPPNKPVWGPRYLAEQIKRKFYHRLVMQQNISTGADGMGQYFGAMAVDTTVQRLDAQPVNNSRRSIFMGASAF